MENNKAIENKAYSVIVTEGDIASFAACSCRLLSGISHFFEFNADAFNNGKASDDYTTPAVWINDNYEIVGGAIQLLANINEMIYNAIAGN